jgi:hypothetical protein
VGKLLELDSKQAAASSYGRVQLGAHPQRWEPSLLTPELKGFIDRVIVPILLQSYFVEMQSEKEIAKRPAVVASCQLMSDAVHRCDSIAVLRTHPVR